LRKNGRKITLGVFREQPLSAALQAARLLVFPAAWPQLFSWARSRHLHPLAPPPAEFAYKAHYKCRSGKDKYFRVVSWATTDRQGKVLRGKADIKLLPKRRW
jgi:hypothetical protein